MGERVISFLKNAGKVLLSILLVLILLAGAFFIWLRAESVEVTECDEGLRLFEHSDGVDCVPDEAKEVLAISPATTQFLAAVGQNSAMMADTIDVFAAADIPGLYERHRSINDGVVDFGLLQGGLGPNFELLFEIEPDVIVTEFYAGEYVKPAEVVAPVVVLTEKSWKEVMLASGDLIGELEVAEMLIAQYEERVEVLRAQFDDPAAVTISNVRLYHDRTSIQLPASFSGQIIEEVGFSFPDAQLALLEDAPNQLEFEISEERTELLDGDYLFIYGGFPDATLVNLGAPSDSLVEAFQSEPLVQFLGAVESEQVYEVDVYWAVTGIYSAHAVLDDLFRYVAGVDPEIVAPNPLVLDS